MNGGVWYVSLLLGAPSIGAGVGMILATLALGCGTIFFLYSMRYYLGLALVLSYSQKELENPLAAEAAERAGELEGEEGAGRREQGGGGEGEQPHTPYSMSHTSNSIGQAGGFKGFLARLFGVVQEEKVGQERGSGLMASLDKVQVNRYPFISVQLPMYNEKKVVDRLLTACTSFDYPAWEDGKLKNSNDKQISNDKNSKQIGNWKSETGNSRSGGYEVIVIDDSTDETTQLLEKWRNHPRVKVVHREDRSGFKGGALEVARREYTDPKAELIVVFDADFVPFPDTLKLFVKYFKASGGWSEESHWSLGHSALGEENKSLGTGQDRSLGENQESGRMTNDLMPNDRLSHPEIAAVQGYQWHVLNKSENWITRGVRTEYSGSYVMERSYLELTGGLKQIAGSVYAIRRDILDTIGWGTSITEDFELTLKLYEKGYKVLYTPYIQAPSECVSTLKRLIRQRMRWAEGHSHNVRKMFTRLMWGSRKQGVGSREQGILSHTPYSMSHTSSSPLTISEKIEWLFLSPYYLQAAFFLLGTLCWLLSEVVFKTALPFWTAVWGWSLVLTNLFSLPLSNTVGLFMEEAEEKDYLGISSFILLSYLLVPFQAYASVKGLLEPEEGTWFRTPKSGLITDPIGNRGTFFRFIRDMVPSLRQGYGRQAGLAEKVISSHASSLGSHASLGYLGVRVEARRQARPRMRGVARLVTVGMVIVSILISSWSENIPLSKQVQAARPELKTVVGQTTIPF